MGNTFFFSFTSASSFKSNSKTKIHSSPNIGLLMVRKNTVVSFNLGKIKEYKKGIYILLLRLVVVVEIKYIKYVSRRRNKLNKLFCKGCYLLRHLKRKKGPPTDTLGVPLGGDPTLANLLRD